MDKKWFDTQFASALKAGSKRDYKKAIMILEDLGARGLADARTGGKPEVYLYLSRAWHAETMYARSVSCARSYIGQCPEDGSGWFFMGRSFLADNKYERAAHALQKSIACNPASIDARTLLGMALLRAKKPFLAKIVFEEALTLAPDDTRLNQGYLNALFVEAVHTYKKGDAETARQMLTFLINNDIDGVVPRLYLGHALRGLGFLPEALSQYEAAIEFAPDDEALRWYPVSLSLEMGETEQAAALMAELGEQPANGPLSDQMVNLVIVKNHLEQGEWANAAEAARSGIRIYGSNAPVHALMGEAQRNLGNDEKALNHFRRALELDRSNPSPYYGIFLVLFAAHDWKTLLAELNRAKKAGCDDDIIRYYRVLCQANLDESPEILLPEIQEQVRIHGAVSELVVVLARTYFRIGLADLATGWYQKAIALESGNEEAHLGYIACCEELGMEQPLQDEYRAYLDIWTDNVPIRLDFMRFLAEHEQWEDAADQGEILASFNPASISTRQIAFFRRKAGQYKKAAILYRNMLRQKPDDRVLLANLVYCLDRMGETEAALHLIVEANRMFKPDADALLIEGRLYLRNNNTESALAVFRKVIDRFPREVRGWEQMADFYTQKGVPQMAALYIEQVRELKNKKNVKKK